MIAGVLLFTTAQHLCSVRTLAGEMLGNQQRAAGKHGIHHPVARTKAARSRGLKAEAGSIRAMGRLVDDTAARRHGVSALLVHAEWIDVGPTDARMGFTIPERVARTDVTIGSHGRSLTYAYVPP